MAELTPDELGALADLRRDEEGVLDRRFGCPECEFTCRYKMARTRPSACFDPTTEDMSRTPIHTGMRVFNYYDGVWGYVTAEPDDHGWFPHSPDEADIGTRRGTWLNGVRVAMYDPNDRRRQ